jgi:AraC family transcriptional regulator of adaptative response / DNA-3-methyladenine glycosylase II
MDKDQDFYRAVCARDARFDGVFFTGVKTTGIYCRPICCAKTPKASSCTFYANAAAAEAAGFRPCLRCRPELAPYDVQENLAYAILKKMEYIGSEGGSLVQLAQQVGLSERQMRRVVVETFGVPPIALLQTQRLLFAKKLLQETALSVHDIAYAAGFSSVRRLNALFLSQYQKTPSSIRQSGNQVNGVWLELKLAYRPPLAWSELLSYLQGRAMPGIEWIDLNEQGGCYARTLQFAENVGCVQVWNDPERAHLKLRISTHLHAHVRSILASLRHLFDLDANPLVIQEHLAHTPTLQQQIVRTPGLRLPGCVSAFELAIRTIIGQQVSVAGATTVMARLIAAFGSPIQTELPPLHHVFPTPEQLSQVDIGAVAALGMPYKRAQTIVSFAQFVAQGGFQIPIKLSLHEFIQQLCELPGIGPWTAQYIAMRAFRYPNAFPSGDLGLQKAAANIGERLTEKQLEQLSQAWAPWRSYAAILLWQSLSTETKERSV